MAQEVTYGGAGGGAFATAARWIKVWVGIVVMAFIIVCLFLVAIISALRAIDRSLATTDPTVGDIRGSTDPLPAHIDTINGTLSAIDANLKPIPGQADTIIGSLTSIDSDVASVDSSLANTSSVLLTALDNLKTEDDMLQAANDAGVERIIDQANDVNPLVDSIIGSTGSIVVSLSRTDGAAKHVRAICNSSLGVGCSSGPNDINP